MELLKKTINRIVVLSALFLSFILVLFYIFYNHNQPKDFTCGNKEMIPFCGTPGLSPEAQEGKQLFNSNCAACHKLDSKAIGPALRNTDSIVFQKWMCDRGVKLDSLKFKKLKIDYHRNLSKNNFTESDLKKIYAYISGS